MSHTWPNQESTTLNLSTEESGILRCQTTRNRKCTPSLRALRASVLKSSSPTHHASRITHHASRITRLAPPSSRFALLSSLLLLLLIATGWWRAAGVGPQVQVPMFYDDHYIYPRPWTQAQEAPGVPDPAPVAFYGRDHFSQPFTATADHLALLELWLAGPAGTEVELSLVADDGQSYGGTITLEDGSGRYYRLTLPPIPHSRGRTFRLTLAAPETNIHHPVLTRTVGGDRLGGSLLTNEYGRPGNLELYTYSRALPGRWWLDSLTEQLLPAVFRLRLQQYKPPTFKSPAFPLLLLTTATLTTLFLLLANRQLPTPNPQSPNPLIPASSSSIQNPKSKIQNYLAWCLTALIFTFLLWQLLSGRLLLPGLTTTIPLRPQTTLPSLASPADGHHRLMQDLTQTLWTAERKPEPRFVTTDIINGYPAIRVPADSSLTYPLTVPLDGYLKLGMLNHGSGSMRFSIWLGSELLHEETVHAGIVGTWLEWGLQPWAGHPGPLRLQTEPLEGNPAGAWLMPQLRTSSNWLLTDPLPPDQPAQPAGHTFANTVQLAAYHAETSDGQLAVDLYWRVTPGTDNSRTAPAPYATVFVHLLDSAGNIIAQHDSQPVNNTYPLPNWQPGLIIADRHLLPLPAEGLPPGPYQLAIGLYDPTTLTRWPATTPTGAPLPDNRALLPLPTQIDN